MAVNNTIYARGVFSKIMSHPEGQIEFLLPGMLPLKYRLTKEKDFKKINTSGWSFFSSWLRLRYLANNQKLSRFAVVVSTKVSKKAVKRNRIKRQLREIIRLNLTKIKPGYDIAVSVNSKALDKDYKDLEKEALRLFTKARLLK